MLSFPSPLLVEGLFWTQWLVLLCNSKKDASSCPSALFFSHGLKTCMLRLNGDSLWPLGMRVNGVCPAFALCEQEIGFSRPCDSAGNKEGEIMDVGMVIFMPKSLTSYNSFLQ